MRCKTLADELGRRGAEVRFVCREQPGHLITLLSDAGYRLSVLAPAIDVDQSVDAEETIGALSGVTPDWLVVDHYGLGDQWETRLRSRVDRIFVIDDLANRRHACDVLLDQNWFGSETQHRYDGLVGQAERLLGPHYALLQPVFQHIRSRLPPRDGVIRRVLLFFGAVDSAHQTVMAMQGLADPDLQDLAVDVVVGHANPDAAAIEALASARSGIVLHRQVPTLADLMAAADLMLGAGGSTTLERCCLGLPAIAVVAADNQRSSTTALAESGIHYSLGDASEASATDWTNAVRELRNSPERVRAYSAASHRLTDGRGVGRVASMLTRSNSGNQ